MNAKTFRALTAAALLATTASVQAEYRCNAPPSRVDARACIEAKAGPDDLRHFIQRMGWMGINLRFVDYVDRDTIASWEADKARAALASAQPSIESASAVKK